MDTTNRIIAIVNEASYMVMQMGSRKSEQTKNNFIESNRIESNRIEIIFESNRIESFSSLPNRPALVHAVPNNEQMMIDDDDSLINADRTQQ